MLRSRHYRTVKDKRENGGDGTLDAVGSDLKMEEDDENSTDAATIATASHYIGKTHGVKRKDVITVHNTPKKRMKLKEGTEQAGQLQDVYCWGCHKPCAEGDIRDCCECPRTFHSACLQSQNGDVTDWRCPVCISIREAENNEKRSFSMMDFVEEDLSVILMHAYKRMRHVDSEPFHHPVPGSLLPDYYDLVFHPQDLAAIEKKIRSGAYRSTTEFLEDTKWISHNSHIYNGMTSKYTNDAKLIIKICHHEMSELELCPDCYRYSTLKPTSSWFTNPCSKPHCLVWAKLKGFPYWPAKVLRLSNTLSQVDVRFFGEHDRAWIHVKDCFLISEEAPLSPKSIKKRGLDAAIDELHDHVVKLRKKFGICRYAPPKTEFTPEHLANCPLLFGDAAEAGMETEKSSYEMEDDEIFEEEIEEEEENVETKDERRDSNGVFELDENYRKQLNAENIENLMSSASNKVSTSKLLPSEEGLGILERLQNSFNEELHSLSSKGAAEECCVPSVASKPPPKLVVQRKRNLDQLVQRMTTGNTTKVPEIKSNNMPSITAKPVGGGLIARPIKTVIKSPLSSQKGIRYIKPIDSPSSSSSGFIASRSTIVGTPGTLDLSQLFQKHADKVCDYLKSTFVTMIEDVKQFKRRPTVVDPQGEIKLLQTQLQNVRRVHETSLNELRTVSNESLSEMRRSFEMEKHQIIVDLQAKHEREIADIKSKQWCLQCLKPALIGCCWKANYCNYLCQQRHWPIHRLNCLNNQSGEDHENNGTKQESENAAQIRT